MTAVVRRPFLRRLGDAAEPWLYSAPALVVIAAVMLVPLVIGISYAFRDIQILNPFSGGFVGLDHFRELRDDKAFLGALRNTLWWTGLTVLIQLVLGLILALLLDVPFRGRGIAQALVFLPWAVPTFLTGLNWAWLFNPTIGPLPHWLYALGILDAPDNILADPNLALWGPITAAVSGGAFRSSRSPFSPRCSRSPAISTRRPRSTAPTPGNASGRSPCPSSRR